MSDTIHLYGERRTGTTALTKTLRQNYPKTNINDKGKHIPPNPRNPSTPFIVVTKNPLAWIHSMKAWWPLPVKNGAPVKQLEPDLPNHTVKDEELVRTGWDRNAVRYLLSGWTRFYRLTLQALLKGAPSAFVRLEDYAENPKKNIQGAAKLLDKTPPSDPDVLDEHAAPFRWQTKEWDPAYYTEKQWWRDTSEPVERWVQEWFMHGETREVLRCYYPDLSLSRPETEVEA